MLSSLEASVTPDQLIEGAPQTSRLCPNFAARPGNNQVWIKRRSQARCGYLMKSHLLSRWPGRIGKPKKKILLR
jgi:hypothetical protein